MYKWGGGLCYHTSQVAPHQTCQIFSPVIKNSNTINFPALFFLQEIFPAYLIQEIVIIRVLT